MQIKRFVVHEYALKGSPSIRGMPAVPPVTDAIERFLETGVTVTRVDMSSVESSNSPAVLLTFEFEDLSALTRPHYVFRVFFERRSGTEVGDTRVNDYLRDCDRPKVATISIGSISGSLVVVTAVISRLVSIE